MRDERGALRAALPRGLPVRALVADDPAQARGVPGGVRGVRPGARRPFDERDVERLLGDASIVRHRGKIEATIANARATVELRRLGPRSTSSSGRIAPESHEPPRSPGRLAARRRRSQRRSRRALRRAGFRFVGPTTAYAAMQACGVVNDHLADCWVRDSVEAARRRGIRPDPSARLWVSAERRWSGVGDFKYGQWRYQLVEACPRDLTGTA